MKKSYQVPDPIRFESVKNYLFCPMLYYWTEVVTKNKPEALRTIDLPKLAIRQALSAFMLGENSQHKLSQWVDYVWGEWLAQAGIIEDDIHKALQSFHDIRYENLLMPFFRGEIRHPGGKKYIEPRATKRYQDLYRTLGLCTISESLNEKILPQLNLVEAEILDLKLGKYSIAQAYSDSIIMAQNFSPPDPGSVWGNAQPVTIKLSDDLSLEAEVDLIVVNEDKSYGYFLDCDPMFYIDRTWVWRRPEILAVGLMEAKDGDSLFPPIKTVYYHHLYSGEYMSRKLLRTSRLYHILIMALRGISANIFIPSYLSGDFSKCKRCTLRSKCFEQEDVLESVFPGSYQIAKEMVRVKEKLTLFDVQ